MQIKIKRFDNKLPFPAYQTTGAVAFDLYARESTKIAPQSVALVPLNVAVEVPAGYWLLLAARSSLHKLGVLLANGIGIGDTDFCGNDDEYRAPLLNFTNHEVTIERGTRIVQMMVMSDHKPKLVEVKKLEGLNRGGIGSTG